MKNLLAVIALLLWTSSASAFVSHMVYSTAPGFMRIPCHEFSAFLGNYIEGQFTAAQLAAAIRRNFLLNPDGTQANWSAQDLIDNANLKTWIDNCGRFNTTRCRGGASPTPQQQEDNLDSKRNAAAHVERMCIMMTLPVDGPNLVGESVVEGRNWLRNRIGIPTE